MILIMSFYEYNEVNHQYAITTCLGACVNVKDLNCIERWQYGRIMNKHNSIARYMQKRSDLYAAYPILTLRINSAIDMILARNLQLFVKTYYEDRMNGGNLYKKPYEELMEIDRLLRTNVSMTDLFEYTNKYFIRDGVEIWQEFFNNKKIEISRDEKHHLLALYRPIFDSWFDINSEDYEFCLKTGKMVLFNKIRDKLSQEQIDDFIRFVNTRTDRQQQRYVDILKELGHDVGNKTQKDIAFVVKYGKHQFDIGNPFTFDEPMTLFMEII